MKISYERSFASHSKSEFWSLKNDKKPTEVYMKSGKKYWFDCKICNHDFEMIICNITRRDSWCPYCSNRLLCTKDECEMCFNNSFASHKKAKYWSEINLLIPRSVFKSSNIINAWFKCEDCNHIFNSNINSIANGNWCPYCCYPCQTICDNKECKMCYIKSFASHDKAKYWSNKNSILPRQIMKNSSFEVLFDCNICNHIFSSKLNNITSSNNNWCPYCATPSKILCMDDCKLCFNRSFASHEKVKYWSKNNTVNPREVRKYSNTKFIFNCNNCNNDFKMALHNVCAGKWCSICKNKTEKKLLEWLKIKYNVKYQLRYTWCKNPITNRYLPYDFEINDKILIELDGRQHFEQVSNWRTPEEQLIIDKYKINCALENNMHIIHIYQEDVYYNKNKWDIILENCINDIILIDKPQLRLIGIDSM